MDARFLPNNLHLDSSGKFEEQDPHISKLKQLPFVYTHALVKQFPTQRAGIYTLTGGGQTGKTTLIKQWMARLLAEGTSSKSIAFFSGVDIKDEQDLIGLLQTQFVNNLNHEMQYVFIDDVNYVKNWDKAIQFTVKPDLLNHLILVLSSSNKTINKNIQLIFSNNEDKINQNTFQLYPLTFHETILLKHPNTQVNELNLFEEFNQYLLHGGYLPAINDMAIHNQILDSTLKTYSCWLKKEILQHGKQEHFLLEVLTAIVKHYNEQVSWNLLSHEISINHPKTIADYVELLESLDAAFVQFALLEDTLSPAPKKSRKVILTDPFIFHAVRAWINPCNDIFKNQIKPYLEAPSKLAESCVVSHYRRYYPTYYIKGEGEINLAYINAQRFWPIVVTWSNQLSTKELKQIMKYQNGKILTKMQRSGIIEHVRTEPLPQALWKLENPIAVAT